MYTPAVTIVAAWIKELTGVGPSMASGSHTYSGIWADLPVAPTKSISVMSVTVVISREEALAKTSLNPTVPKWAKIRKMPSKKPKSPTLLTTKAFLPALAGASRSNQKPMRRYEQSPTPVSSLIHAATLVTSGVYLTPRCHVLYNMAPVSMAVVAIVGAATALYAATMGLVQFDIKRVLAYSTISQLGYMFLAVGVGAFSAGIFHLMTHAFFKGLLFLGAGSVMHASSGELDMRN